MLTEGQVSQQQAIYNQITNLTVNTFHPVSTRGPGGERQLWLPVEWRAKAREKMDWCPQIGMKFSSPHRGLIVIKLSGTPLVPLPP